MAAAAPAVKTRLRMHAASEGVALIDKVQRLAFFSRLLWPTTRNALQWAELQRGNRVLDLGCGNGHATLGLASFVGRVGRITGVDTSAKALESAAAYVQQNRDEDAMARVSFLKAEIPNNMAELANKRFDLVYSRLLFSYVPEPLASLETCKELLWPGGRILVEDVDYSSSFCYPSSPAFDRYKELHTAISAQLKGHPLIGPKLYSMVKEAGFVDARVRVVQPVFTHADEGRAVARASLQDIRNQVLAHDLASESELAELDHQLRELEHRPDALISLPRIFQVTARVPTP
ncbi:uncharacterized protein MONBRDRAFT_9348 [Monosiga brevicollis MX1]|uniref:Methyltransferase domain-containing protein n=1 Tax=Monosiga brevicollis TaxID=81824 RepID=A9V2V4_MONBE|nr:uncharacterized protein MONBRDRAFT_9348 [Monosiga brevicollis MX1]EDQ88078.1 predicted protein [Monosiga brevicollis MX1]|eukprot:XP_001747154.1 hypothetical protein [Monosiga brevicollis MX1]